jgi:large subunit ribosomal protein L30e
MDVNRALRMVIDNGKVYLGARQTERALKSGKVKLVVVANNCQRSYLQKFDKHSNVPIYRFTGNNIELGSACGKPFPISSLAVIETGTSNIMDLIKK